jgi:ABC-type multidrug transport system fused ATPase/permease subunit
VFTFTGVLVLTNSLILIKGGINASTKIHNSMLACILRAPCSFFDTTPLGRILNRFTKDINAVDDSLPSTVSWASRLILSVISPVLVIAIVTPFFLTLLLPLCKFSTHTLLLFFHFSLFKQFLSLSPVYLHISHYASFFCSIHLQIHSTNVSSLFARITTLRYHIFIQN